VRIAIVSSFMPFVGGGARSIVSWLETMMVRHGIDVEVIDLPFSDDPRTISDEMVAYRLLDVASKADRMIAIRPPCHVLRHPHKVLWFIHHIRSFYDLWGSPYCPVNDNAQGRLLRRSVVEMDDAGLVEAKAIFTNSAVVSDRLRRFNGVPSSVLYPPVFEPERFRCDGYGEAIVYICRVEHHKRQHLLIEAMAFTTTAVRLVVCGASSDARYEQSLRQLIADHDLADKVTLNLVWIAEDHKVELLSRCLAAAYLPVDEDSYGYPSLEAHHAEKAVITCTDSGGTLELIVDGDNGFVVEPDARALAGAMDALYADRALARRMGQRGPERVREIGVTWERVIAAFTG
jgi:glycosyltransferase involved in cell wall biosynthesis